MGKPIYGDTVGGGGGNLKKIPQSDWNQTDETQLDYIKNKPTILTDEDIENIIEESGGATFVPSVSNDGILSWTNDKGLKNPTPVNVVGPKGDAYTLTKADMGEIIEYMAQGLIPISNGTNIHALELDKEYKLKGNISQFTNPTSYLDIDAIVESDKGVYFQNVFKFQNRYDKTVTSPTLKVSVTEGDGVYILVLEYCGKTYTYTYTPKADDEFFVITNISLCFTGQVYLIDSTIIPKYEVTEEIKTEIANMVLNEMERAEDWVL